MEKDNQEALRAVSQAGSIGFTLVLATFCGLGAGMLVDRLTGLKPLFTIVMLLFGIISGFVWVIVKYAVKK
ncbi:MAG TPA: AtpZ/AtpI family protein [Candidatus Goldiibacteriota bacterium]|nr:AtpZ/AtpI family protein [Candidatus Goldiibacteriota bacterium]